MPTKRFKFQCWNCPRVYFHTLEITDQQEISVACPYCGAEATADLKPYGKRARTVLRTDENNAAVDAELPDILPTSKSQLPGNPTTDAPPPEIRKKKSKDE